MTGSLLRGDVASSQGEEEACPPLLPVPQRLQSTVHCINLSVQQVGGSRETVLQHLSQQIPDQQSVCLSVCSRGSCLVSVEVSAVEKPL